jgi:hypothetical protein
MNRARGRLSRLRGPRRAVRPWRIAFGIVVVCAAGTLVEGCKQEPGPRLEKADDDADFPIPEVPVPAADGPRLGALADVTAILDRPSPRGTRIGYLHAGATVARALEPAGKRGCDAGWYPVRPKGFVCAAASATTDLRHPTLVAMALRPNLEAPLPYTYARATRDTTIYEPDPARADAVRAVGELREKSGLAAVGSWKAVSPDGKELSLAMTTDGRFVPTAALTANTASAFAGKVLGDDAKLPLAFVVKRGVFLWKLRETGAEKDAPLDYHARVDLTGRQRMLESVELWETTDHRWVRLRDVTVVRERHELPGFVTEHGRWLDVSVVTGTLVAYEGRKPLFATLVSVGRDRLGAPESDAATHRGEFTVTAKEVTAMGRDDAAFGDHTERDVPWVLELSSGQLVLGAYWHDRFGIEHGPGNIELSPADAAWVFRFAGPDVPEGWHGVQSGPFTKEPVVVNVRK